MQNTKLLLILDGYCVTGYLISVTLLSGKIPHWDAANSISRLLAISLGYESTENYSAYRVEKLGA